MDDEGDDDPVPLPNVNAAILKKVSGVDALSHIPYLVQWTEGQVNCVEMAMENLSKVPAPNQSLLYYQ